MESHQPARRTLTSGARLPADLTSFEGRRSSLGLARKLLSEARLVTLVGIGGVGKTRLALRVAREVARSFPDGVAWVELADLRDPALLTQAVADALDLPDRPGRDTWEALLQRLGTQQCVVVLDNCEHLRVAVARLVNDLLSRAPGVRVLATSRQMLGIQGERTLQVDPLPIPPPERAQEAGVAALYPALALFRERASAAVPGFELTPVNQVKAIELCRKLEGIPLAIELAAVKLRALSLTELVDRLDSRLHLLSDPSSSGPTRHRTIEATIDWSYDLCTDDERALWARASVFAGGFTIEAAEAVCADERLPRESVLDVVHGLVEKSILARTEADGSSRFRLLEPLREHGLARLRDLGEEDACIHRHVSWVSGMLDEACLQWFGPTQVAWCTSLRAEHANIRAAADHCCGHPPCTETALVMLGKPWFLWIALFLDEGRQWLERAVAACPQASVDRARALATLGYVASLQGDHARASEVTRQARELAQAEGDEGAEAYAAHVEGLSLLFADAERSVPLLEVAHVLYSRYDALDDHVVALRIQLALALLFVGEVDRAQEHFEACRDLSTLTGERWLLSYALYGLAFVAKVRGDPDAAIEMVREAIEMKWFFRDLCGLATAMDLLGWSLADAGRHADAAVFLGATESLWNSFGVRLFGSADWLEPMKAAEALCRKALGDRGFTRAVEVGQALDWNSSVDLALGRTSMPSAPHLLRGSDDVRLTKRERQIAGLVAAGLSNREIASTLVISQRTAEGHVENILAKLGFRSRTQVATWFRELQDASGSR